MNALKYLFCVVALILGVIGSQVTASPSFILWLSQNRRSRHKITVRTEKSPPIHSNNKPKKQTSSTYRPGNLHFLFYSRQKLLKVFGYQGYQLYHCSCKNETFGIGFLHWGACPHGTFRLGRAVSVHSPAFGDYFVPLYDLSSNGPMHHYQRTGIGLHGGGSKLSNPFKEYQQLLKTHGCLRVANHDLKVLVKLIHQSRAKGRVSYITVM